MQRRAWLAAFNFFLILAPRAGRAAEGESPREIVETYYRLSATKSGWKSAFLRRDIRARTFSKEFLKAVKAADAKDRKGDESWLDFDPISNSQDPSVNGLRTGVASESPGKATIRAEFRTEPGANGATVQIFYDFVREDGAWKLDDVRSSGDDPNSAWSIRRLARDAVSTTHR